MAKVCLDVVVRAELEATRAGLARHCVLIQEGCMDVRVLDFFFSLHEFQASEDDPPAFGANDVSLRTELSIWCPLSSPLLELLLPLGLSLSKTLAHELRTEAFVFADDLDVFVGSHNADGSFSQGDVSLLRESAWPRPDLIRK